MFTDGQPRFTPTTFRLHMLVDHPHHSPSPVLYFPTSCHSQEFPQSLAARPIIGLHPEGLQDLCFPRFKTKERAQS